MILFKLKFRLNCDILLLLFLFVTSFILSNVASARTYTGNVKSFLTSTISQGDNGDFNGVIMHVARVGEIIKPEIRNVKTGKVVRKGTTLIKLRPDYFKADLLAAQSDLIGAEADLALGVEEYKRACKLVATKTVSLQIYGKAKADYYEALSKVETAKSAIIQANEILDSLVIKAPFVGIVDKVFLTSGVASGQPPVITISQLSPIKIEVPMTRLEANDIKIDTPVNIYSMRDDKPVGIFHGYTTFTEKGIVFGTHNRRMNTGNVDYKGKKVSYVHKVFPVDHFFRNSDSKVICVPLEAVFKDSKGSYVWKSEGVKTNQPGKGINSFFSVSKNYIVLENLKRNVTGYVDLVAIKNSSKIQVDDLIIVDPPADLKNGDTVCYDVDRFLFMPGDQVKVVIGKD
ncbi:MAG: efflux RND transporter periplasmic adaptor subunit [bacterium]|nr:efflux RND transporter periplasmic adaptor subunit [bacterium]